MPSRSRRLIRLLPSCAVLVLVFAAAAGMRTPPAPEVAAALPCDSTLVASSSDDVFVMPQYWGVTQPFDPTTNAQACSLRVGQTYERVDDFRVVSWDTAAQTAVAGTVPLRWFVYDLSALEYNHLRQDFGARPIVTQRLGHVADPPGTRFALQFFGPSFLSGGENISYAHAGSASTPTATTYPIASPASALALPGAHPVLSYGLCAGDAATQALVLAQGVMTANALLDTTWYELAQRFRVPALTHLEWFEFAMDNPIAPGYPLAGGIVQVADGAQPLPSGAFASPLAQAAFGLPGALPQWTSHTDFDLRVTLMPDHDYWVLLRTYKLYSFRARAITGAESSDFQNGIGALYGRTAANGAWTPITDRALSMRLIGTPSGIVGAPEAPLAPGARLRLALTPNPSRGSVLATWSGGAGSAHLEVLDARGRRVASGSAGTAANGRWLWSGSSDDGRRVPAGLYFVRLRDDAGHGAAQRVVIVR